MLAIFIFIFAVYSSSEALKSDDMILRVCVLKDAKEMTLSVKGDYRISALNTNELIEKGSNLSDSQILPAPSGLSVSGRLLMIYGVKVVPRRDASVYIGKRSFRGNLDIIRTTNMRLLVVNHINVEDYLKGVLYHEVSHWWPIEALKAQAIAARTYALYQKSVRRDKEFDLTNDIYSQMYGGRLSEKLKTNRAVDLTKGKVLTYRGEIFPAYYHATCGGHTEDASNLWDVDLPPLDGVWCDFCRHSPHYRWKRKISLSELESKLSSAGYKIGNLKTVKPLGKTASGRIRELKLVADKETIIPAKEFRLIIGPNFIRSTNFKIKSDSKNIMFYGRGWGHGVGMCQWGAFFLALKRYKADRILRHYYPGTTVKKY